MSDIVRDMDNNPNSAPYTFGELYDYIMKWMKKWAEDFQAQFQVTNIDEKSGHAVLCLTSFSVDDMTHMKIVSANLEFTYSEDPMKVAPNVRIPVLQLRSMYTHRKQELDEYTHSMWQYGDETYSNNLFCFSNRAEEKDIDNIVELYVPYPYNNDDCLYDIQELLRDAEEKFLLVLAARKEQGLNIITTTDYEERRWTTVMKNHKQ